MMNFSFFAGVVVMFLFIFGGIYVSFLNSKIEKLSQDLSLSASANKNLAHSLDAKAQELQNLTKILESAKKKNEKERAHVERVKYKIIKDNNATCVNAVNDVFKRLHARDSNHSNAN